LEIYVGNLFWEIAEGDLADLFKPYGEVGRVSLAYDRATERPRGFGFVQMPNDEQGRAAMEGLNGTEFHGRSLRVNQSLKDRGHASFKTKGA
jgi:RNA recognition motif-containing protein